MPKDPKIDHQLRIRTNKKLPQWQRPLPGIVCSCIANELSISLEHVGNRYVPTRLPSNTDVRSVLIGRFREQAVVAVNIYECTGS